MLLLLGLTSAVASRASALLDADSLRKVAAELGIGLATVRCHLHPLLGKAAIRRQAELAWLLATLAVQLFRVRQVEPAAGVGGRDGGR